MLKQLAITSLAAAALFSTATVVTAPLNPAQAQVTISFGVAPPPAPYEAAPAPRAGQVWAPGHCRLVNDQYVWTPGRWLEARPGYRYVPDAWERYHVDGRERWRYVPSRWDRDGDGVPNHVDRHDNRPHDSGPPYHGDPYHGPKGAWGDRDRDGIPNKHDPVDNRQGALGDKDGDGVPNVFDAWNSRH